MFMKTKLKSKSSFHSRAVAQQFAVNRGLHSEQAEKVGEPVQRIEEEELMQGKFDPLQRIEEEELMQGKFDAGKNVSTSQLQEDKPENKTGMPDNLKTGVESLSGFDMSDVRVHHNSSKPQAVQAHAYAQGSDIYVAPGQDKHIPHEAWHVAQQKAGRVKPTTTVAGMPVNDNPSLENEADVMGNRAMQFKPRR